MGKKSLAQPFLQHVCLFSLIPEKLRSTFTHLKFKVEEITDPSADDINRALMGVSQRDHSAYDCLVICILSHGGPNYFYGSDGKKFDEKRLSELFRY